MTARPPLISVSYPWEGDPEWAIARVEVWDADNRTTIANFPVGALTLTRLVEEAAPVLGRVVRGAAIDRIKPFKRE